MDECSTRKCAYAGCTCEIADGQTCCGPFCATAAADAQPHPEQVRCDCGHDSCHAAAVAAG